MSRATMSFKMRTAVEVWSSNLMREVIQLDKESSDNLSWYASNIDNNELDWLSSRLLENEIVRFSREKRMDGCLQVFINLATRRTSQENHHSLEEKVRLFSFSTMRKLSASRASNSPITPAAVLLLLCIAWFNLSIHQPPHNTYSSMRPIANPLYPPWTSDLFCTWSTYHQPATILRVLPYPVNQHSGRVVSI
jgi:hypothetical protein